VGQPPANETPEQRRVREALASVGQAVRLSYIGDATRQTVPDVVRSFVLDQDLADPTPARRPLNSRMSLEKLERTFGVVMPSWQDALARNLEAKKRMEQKS
jgi:hypothetical protein